MQKDNREFSRTKVHAEADITIGKTRIHGRVSDLSVRGVLLLSRDRFPEKTECTVDLYLAGHCLRISAKGRIVRTLEDGLAVEFTGIDLDSFEHLRNLVRIHAENVSRVDGELKNHLGLKRPRVLGEEK